MRRSIDGEDGRCRERMDVREGAVLLYVRAWLNTFRVTERTAGQAGWGVLSSRHSPIPPPCPGIYFRFSYSTCCIKESGFFFLHAQITHAIQWLRYIDGDPEHMAEKMQSHGVVDAVQIAEGPPTPKKKVHIARPRQSFPPPKHAPPSALGKSIGRHLQSLLRSDRSPGYFNCDVSTICS